MQTNWYNLFKWNSTITYECCDNSDHKSQQMTTNRILRLPVMDDDRKPITSLNDSVDKLFKEELIERDCENCNSKRSIK